MLRIFFKFMRPLLGELCRAAVRALLALERLSFLESEGQVGYRHAQAGAEQETIDYLEFIARVTSHIPDKGQVKDSLAAHESKMLEAEGRAKYD